MRTTALVAMLALATVAACAKKAEPVAEPAPAVSTEPTYTGKYK
jgi:predicted small lipoprotein YifL